MYFLIVIRRKFMKKTIVFICAAFLGSLLIFSAACSSGAQPTAENPVPGKVIKSGPIGTGMTVSISSDSGTLKNGEQEIYLSFTDASGKRVYFGTVMATAFNFQLRDMVCMG
jgi:hypothetical protein